jgi:hypothetical protein
MKLPSRPVAATYAVRGIAAKAAGAANSLDYFPESHVMPRRASITVVY